MKKQALQPNHWDDCARYLSCARRARCALSPSPGILTKEMRASCDHPAGQRWRVAPSCGASAIAWSIQVAHEAFVCAFERHVGISA